MDGRRLASPGIQENQAAPTPLQERITVSHTARTSLGTASGSGTGTKYLFFRLQATCETAGYLSRKTNVPVP